MSKKSNDSLKLRFRSQKDVLIEFFLSSCSPTQFFIRRKGKISLTDWRS